MAFYEQTFNISFHDTGNSNTLTNRAFLSYMEDAGGMHSDSVGYGINNISTTNLSWVLLGWKVKVLSRPIYGTPIKVKTWARHTEKFYTYRDFEVYDNLGKLLCIATSKWVLIDITKGKLTKITPEILSKYKPEEKSVFDTLSIDKLKEPDACISSFNYTVLRCNIDINKHMHNLYYLDLAYEALPEDIYNNYEFNNIEIMYKKEIKLGDTVKCLYSTLDNSHIVVIKSIDESILHAIIKLS